MIFGSGPKTTSLAFSFRDSLQTAPVANMRVEVDCGESKVEVESREGPLYRYKVSPGSEPVECRIQSRDETHEPIDIRLRVAPGDHHEQVLPLLLRARQNPKTPGQPTPVSRPTISSPELSRLALEYDTASATFYAARRSMVERIRDLGGQPVKPELQAAMDGGQLHLQAAKQALASGQASVASQRIEQVKRSIQVLNSM